MPGRAWTPQNPLQPFPPLVGKVSDLAVLGAGLIDGTATEEEALLMDAPWVKADRTAASRKRGCCPMLDWWHLAGD